MLNAKESKVTTEDEDATMARLNMNRAQNTLSPLMDNSTARRLTTQLETQARRRDIDRLQELRGPHASHEWARMVDPAQGPILPPEDYAICTSHRLGCEFRAHGSTYNVC